MPYDLVLRGATVIDPSQEIHGVYDVAIAGDKIAAVENNITEPSRSTLDLAGRILTPGWIDIHAHVYAGATTWGIVADAFCLSTGVTTIVDAGSAGWANFLGFRDYVVEPSRTQVLIFVHISGIGLTYGPLGEMADLRYGDPERTACVVDTWSDICVGVKVRQGRFQVGENGVEPLKLAIQSAAMVDRPVMVHIGDGVPLPEVLALLRPADIVTHCYQGKGDSIVQGGDVLDEVWKAREQGVLFDLGHGGGSFHYEIAKQALAKGFSSDVISTDIHNTSFEDPVWSLPETASKLLNLGVGLLEEVVRQTTLSPAIAIGRSDQLGTLKPGTVADLAAFEIQEGEFAFHDVADQRETGFQNDQPSTHGTRRPGV